MNRSPTILWPAPPEQWRLNAGEIHVFAAPLDIPAEQLARVANLLSPDETDRAGRFKFERHRNRYIAARAALRKVLGHALQRTPASFKFTYSEHGKPGLECDDTHFNLAHSEDLALIAVTRSAALGVDVECIRVVKEVEELVKRFFSPRESAAFQRLVAEEKPAAFFNLWTRKEAMLKATGEGISGGLNRVEVSFLNGESARVLAIGNDSAEAQRWTLWELQPASGYVGAVAIQTTDIQLHTWKMTNDE